MNCTLLILVVMFFSLTLNFIFYFKKHIKTRETKIFSYLLIVNLFGLIIELICAYIGYNLEMDSIYAHIFTKIYLLYLMTYLFIMTLYVYSIAYSNVNENYYNKLKVISYVIYFAFSIITVCLPINTFAGYAMGYAVNFVYIASTLCMTIWLIPIFKNIKTISKTKILPFFCLMGLMIIVAFLQSKFPSLTLITVTEFLVIFIMYHTIENPDLKIIDELKKNRSLTSKSYIEKTNFLFRMSAEVRKPLDNIRVLNSANMESKSLSDIRENSRDIDLNVRNANFTINNVLDVTGLDSKKINIIKNKYNVKKLFNEIKLRESKKIKNIRFDFNIGEIPEYLYGDSIRLKNVLICILDNLIENTSSGFIEVNINSITKYDVCRLIITIENSGKALSLDEINNILDNDKEINDDITLYDINKIINMMNGSLNITSDDGNEFVISIDSVIVEPKKEEITNDTDILFVSNDERLLKQLELLFEGYTISSVMNGVDAIDVIRAGERYNLIIVDDDMEPISGLETLKRLKSLDIDIPAIVMLDSGKEVIKNHYIKDGFIDYILKDNLKDEVNRIIKKMM